MDTLLKKKDFQLGGKTYKKVPRGFNPDYKYRDLLLHSGIYVFYESDDFEELRKPSPVNFAFNFYKKSSPLHNWLVKNIV